MGRGAVVPATDITVTWRERKLNETRGTLKKSATHYATGQKIASFVKGSEYKVIQVGSGKCLLGGIVSWVNNSDLTLL